MNNIDRMNNLVKTTCFAFGLLFILSACSSSPATRFYTLYADNAKTNLQESNSSKPSIGIGPIYLPAYLDNTALVSRSVSQVVNVSGYHAWAGALDNAIIRVLSSDIGSALAQTNVWPFPWDMRARPDIQLTLNIDQFDGVRGGDVVLSLTWNAFKVDEGKQLAYGQVSRTVSSAGKDYDSYVKALNEVLNKVSADLAAELKKLR